MDIMVVNARNEIIEVIKMAKAIINPDRVITIEDELIEDLAMSKLLVYVKEAMDAKAAQEQRKEKTS